MRSRTYIEHTFTNVQFVINEYFVVISLFLRKVRHPISQNRTCLVQSAIVCVYRFVQMFQDLTHNVATVFVTSDLFGNVYNIDNK